MGAMGGWNWDMNMDGVWRYGNCLGRGGIIARNGFASEDSRRSDGLAIEFDDHHLLGPCLCDYRLI